MGGHRPLRLPPPGPSADLGQPLLAVCLGTGAVVSHRSAAALWELDGFGPVRLEVSVPAGGWVRRRGMTIHETTQWDQTEPVARQGLQVTGIERTLVDLAAVVGPTRLRQGVDDARRRRLTDGDRLARAAEAHGRRGRNGTAALRALLHRYQDGGVIPRSDWSHAMADLLLAAGLPRPAFEHPVADGGGFRAELDLAYPEQRVGIELDSLAWHFDYDSFQRDPVRRNRLTTLGWRVLTFTWAEFVDHPDRLVATIRSALLTSF